MDPLREPSPGADDDPYLSMVLGLVAVSARWQRLVADLAPPLAPSPSSSSHPHDTPGDLADLLLGALHLARRVDHHLARVAPAVDAPDPSPSASTEGPSTRALLRS